MIFNRTSISGCYEIQYVTLTDHRGFFQKTFNYDIFIQNGIDVNFKEEYFSFSNERVLRGLHFQLPPFEHAKLVYCITGKVLDAVVDLRVGSPSYRQSIIIELSPEKGNGVFVPAGCAHGVYSLSPDTIIVNKTTTVYSPDSDSGILWDSADIDWPDNDPILSDRDRKLISLKDFKSPFIFKG